MNIEQILDQYNIPACLSHLECDGSTNVISQVLQAHDIPHQIATGMLVISGRKEITHFWITLPDGRYVDFKARMWVGVGPDTPEGIFDPAPFRRFYRLLSERPPVEVFFLAEILAGIRLGKT